MNTSLLTDFAPISLDQMKGITLMNRIDTKFVMPADRIGDFLSRCKEHYDVQQIGDVRLATYDTLYYDTESYDAFQIHQRGKSPRQKVRVRCYVDGGGDCFIEIKNKTNKGRTKKKRVTLSRDCFENFASDRAAAEFSAPLCLWDINALSPALRISFRRITLVNKEKTERITVDTGLAFFNPRTGESYDLSDIVVIELKRDGNIPSRMQNILLDMRIMPAKFSKYCTGIMLTTPGIQLNRFKPRLIALKKLLNDKFVFPPSSGNA